MKKLILTRFQTYLSIVLLALTLGIVTSCKDEDETVTPLAITSFSPTSGAVGTTVTITGTGFNATLANNAVKFGSVNATPTAATATSITVTVPEGLADGAYPVIVSVTANSVTTTTASTTNFTVTSTSKPIVEVAAGSLTGTVNWTKDKIYRLNGFVRVGADDGSGDNAQATAILNIQAGTLIIGDRETKGTLVVQRGSTINATGTAAEPIVFTSERAVGLREPGDWGGVVICGYADNNVTGKVAQLEGGYGAWHGGKGNVRNTDNSGTFRYVRIEYAGIAINPNQEVNSLTMGSLGSGTTIEYVQCSYGLDDAFEWFGGSANAKYLIAYRGLDDDFDVDLGFTGNVQYGLGIRGASLADQSGSNGFEVDGPEASGTPAQPFTAPTFSNMSIFGPKANRETAVSLQFQNALHLRRGSKIKIHNSFFTAYPNGVLIDGANCVTFAGNGDLLLKNNILAGVDNWGGNGFGNAGTIYGVGTLGNGANHPNAPRGFRVAASNTGLASSTHANGVWTIADPANIPATPDPLSPEAWFDVNNDFISGWNTTGVNLNLNANIFQVGTPTLLPGTGSVLLTGASFTGLPTPFFTTTGTFRGAFGTTDWTATGWVEWNPNIKDYEF